MVWGVGQLATGPLLTLTIIVINSDTQSSLFTGGGGRESREISLFIGEGPFHKVQSFIIWADGVGGMRRGGLRVGAGCRGSGAPQLKTRGDLATGGSCRGGEFKRGRRNIKSKQAAVRQP